MKPYLWHPMAVHFTVALLIMAALFYVLARVIRKEPLHHELAVAGRWTLWTGTLLTLGTVALGLVAFNTVHHDEVSHAIMKVHRAWALSTLALFVVLGIWAFVRRHQMKQPSVMFLSLLLVGVGLLGTTAWFGGELVYTHGLGVAALPAADHHHHHGGETDHDDGADAKAPAGADNAMANMPGMASSPAANSAAGTGQKTGVTPANADNKAAAGNPATSASRPSGSNSAAGSHTHADGHTGHHHDD